MIDAIAHAGLGLRAAVIAGLALGLASSVHCVAMCGPLVLAVGRLSPPGRRGRAVQALLHHTARAAVYVLLAVPGGVAGQSLVLHGFARALAIGAGLLLLVATVGSIWRPAGRIGAIYSRWLTQMAAPLFRWAASHRVAGPLATGAINGVLPCGLVYAALTTAGATGSAAAAMLMMLGFGAATGGVLVALSLGAGSIPVAWRARLRPLGPIVLATTAALLIARGVATPELRGPAELSTIHHHHL